MALISRSKSALPLEWRNTDSGPACRVVDAADTSWANEPILGRMLSREYAMAFGRATEVFAVADAVWLNDRRLLEALDGS